MDVIGVSGGCTAVLEKESPEGVPSTNKFGELHAGDSDLSGVEWREKKEDVLPLDELLRKALFLYHEACCCFRSQIARLCSSSLFFFLDRAHFLSETITSLVVSYS